MASLPATDAAPRPRLTGLIVAGTILFFLNALSAAQFPFPAPIDELAHFSYSVSLTESPRLFPAYEEMRLQKGACLDCPSDTPNYLVHPSVYYHMARVPIWVCGNDPGCLIASIRGLNIALGIAGFILLLAAGLPLLESGLSRALYVLILATTPKMHLVAGLANNDNLALVAVGLTFFGLSRLSRDPEKRTGVLLACLGLALGGWAKLNAGLACGMAVSAFLFLSAKTHLAHRRQFLTTGILFGGATLLASIPTLMNIATYGGFFYDQSASYSTPVEDWVDYGFVEFLLLEIKILFFRYAAFEVYQAWQVVVPIGVMLLFLLRLLLVKGQPRPPFPILPATLLVTLVFASMHLYSVWSSYLKTGYLGGNSFRYYLPIWPYIVVCASSTLDVIPRALRLMFLVGLGVFALMNMVAIKDVARLVAWVSGG